MTRIQHGIIPETSDYVIEITLLIFLNSFLVMIFLINSFLVTVLWMLLNELEDDISCVRYNKLDYVTEDVVEQDSVHVCVGDIWTCLPVFNTCARFPVFNTCARFVHNDECWGFASTSEWLLNHLTSMRLDHLD